MMSSAKKIPPPYKVHQKNADQPYYNVIFYLRRAKILKKGILLTSVARSLLFRLHILTNCFYKKKKKIFNTVLTLNAVFHITDNVALIM